MILFTCMVGQLNTQVNASHHMLDYIDNYFGLFTLWFAMFVEFTGFLHSLSLLPWRLSSPDRQLCGKVYQHGSPLLFSSSSCPLLVCLRVCRLLSSLLPKSRPRTVVTVNGLR